MDDFTPGNSYCSIIDIFRLISNKVIRNTYKNWESA